MPESLPLILVLPVLLLLSAIASGSETALFRLSYRERAELRRASPTAGAAVEALLSDPRRLLLFVLLLNMVVNVTYFVISSVLTTRMQTGVGGVAVAAGSVLGLVIFGEVLAKLVAGTGRRAFCLVLAPPLAALQVILNPVVGALDVFVLGPLIRVIRPHRHGAGPVTPGELHRLIETGGASGVLMENERRLLAEVIELGQIRVREAMRPRDRIVSVPINATAEEIVAVSSATRRTAILVHEGSLDEGVVGFLHVKRYLAARHAGPADPDPLAFIEPALAVPEQARLDGVLDLMRERGRTRAVCVDEHGGVVGVIEAADIVDELLSGMSDERTAERSSIRLVGLGVWSVSARLSARDWAQCFGVDESEIAPSLSRASTIGGVVIDRLGRLPEPGDAVEIGPVRVRVGKITGRRVETVQVELIDAESGGGGA